jgi:hypothetical protein
MLSVHQFVSHLDLEAQGALLVSQEAFLAFLRERYSGPSDLDAQARRDLEQAARDHADGKPLRVEALPDEREAAKAVLYAVMRLADRLKASQPELPSAYRTYRDEGQKLEGASTQKRWRAGYNGAGGWATKDDLYPRFPFVVTVTADGRETARLTVHADKLEQTLEDVKAGRGFSRRYVAAIAATAIQGERLEWRVSHPHAEKLARRMLLEARLLAKRCPRLTAPPVLDALPTLEIPRAVPLPSVGVEPEVVEVSETLHFDASSHPTGYATVFVDGEPVDRVRCWSLESPSPEPKPEIDLIRGGTIRRATKPKSARPLRLHEERVIELEATVLPVPEAHLSAKQRALRPEDRPWFALPRRAGSERSYGRGTHGGELWLRGTADAEVMRLHAARLIASA